MKIRVQTLLLAVVSLTLTLRHARTHMLVVVQGDGSDIDIDSDVVIQGAGTIETAGPEVELVVEPTISIPILPAHQKQQKSQAAFTTRNNTNKSSSISNKSMDANTNIKVISYSLYGTEPRYWKGMINVAKATPLHFPDWHIWIYHDNSVPVEALEKLTNLIPDRLKLINVETDLGGISEDVYRTWNPMTWRFLVASANNVEAFCIRDADALPSPREARAVTEWLASGRSFHVMRDHLMHNPQDFAPILGGMWGARGGAVSQMETLLQEYYSTSTSTTNAMHIKPNATINNMPPPLRRHRYADDQDFLWTQIMPMAYQDVLQHDSYFCRESHAVAFPPLPSEIIANTSNNGDPNDEEYMKQVLNDVKNHSRFWFVGNQFAKSNRMEVSNFLKGKLGRRRYQACLEDRLKVEADLRQEQQQQHGNGKVIPAQIYFAQHVNTTYTGKIQGLSTEAWAETNRKKNRKKNQ